MPLTAKNKPHGQCVRAGSFATVLRIKRALIAFSQNYVLQRLRPSTQPINMPFHSLAVQQDQQQSLSFMMVDKGDNGVKRNSNGSKNSQEELQILSAIALPPLTLHSQAVAARKVIIQLCPQYSFSFIFLYYPPFFKPRIGNIHLIHDFFATLVILKDALAQG